MPSSPAPSVILFYHHIHLPVNTTGLSLLRNHCHLWHHQTRPGWKGFPRSPDVCFCFYPSLRSYMNLTILPVWIQMLLPAGLFLTTLLGRISLPILVQSLRVALLVPPKVNKWIFPSGIAMGQLFLRVLEALLFRESAWLALKILRRPFVCKRQWG